MTPRKPVPGKRKSESGRGGSGAGGIRGVGAGGRMRRSRIELRGHAPLVFGRQDLPPLRSTTVIDLTDLEFASPLDIAALASLISTAPAEAMIELVPPASEPVANYLLRMELPAVLGDRVLIKPPFASEWPRDETPALIELAHIRRSTDLEIISARVWDRLTQHMPTDTCVNLFKIIGELVDNAATHGASPSGTFLAAQYYTGRTSGMPEGFWIAVADAGVGVRAHLAQNPRHRDLDDVHAIQAAVQPRVTGTDDVKRGWGLVSVRQEAGREAAGRLIIRSGTGEGWFFLGPDGTSTARYRVRELPVKGTWILALAGRPQATDG